MKKTLITTALLALAFTAQANTAAAPLGLQIGSASCDEARKALGHSTEQDAGGDVLITAKAPGSVYGGATGALARCSGGKVIAVQLKIGKGGMGNPQAIEVYGNLRRKYKLAAGGPMPSLGNGYARFNAGDAVIEQDSPHLSFEFTVTYYTRAFYDAIVASNKKKEKEQRELKDKQL